MNDIPIYPANFLWGAATSAYQIEGGIENDWQQWERLHQNNGSSLQRCELATDHWHRYPEDFALLEQLGCNAYRFSLEWSRLCPEPGQFDETVMRQYLQMVEHLRAMQIEPVATLHHFTHPQWFHSLGSWQNPETTEHFLRFVDYVVAHLGKHVRWWITINEPTVLVLGGYLSGQIPPGLQDLSSGLQAFTNLIECHNASYQRIHRARREAKVGIAHNMMVFVPRRSWHPLDRLATKIASNFYNWALVEAIEKGMIATWLPTGYWQKRFAQRGLIDFWGINYYSRVRIQFDPRAALRLRYLYVDDASRGASDLGWEIYPEGLRKLIEPMAKYRRPMLITENGLADANDSRRPAFLRAHIAEIDTLLKKGVPLAGYFHWSLMDNFEWLEGFTPRFGLFGVDYKTLDRFQRPSAKTYRDLILERTAPAAKNFSNS